MAVTANDVLELMKEAGIKASVVASLKNDVPLLSQGMDSLDIPIVAAAVEAKYGVKLSSAQSSQLKTINDLAAFLSK
ncbi:MAG: phosphopantetheine-binding [Burkholderiaceae bacterium]|nr:phosphopantetheine-binding [Burkholderiaceae bacterium]